MLGKTILQLLAIATFLALVSFSDIGQTHNTDSLKISGEKIFNYPRDKSDSIQTIINDRADSLRSLYDRKLSNLDSIKKNSILARSNNKIDSIQSMFSNRSDSLQGAYKNKIAKLDSVQTSLTKELDSLTILKIPNGKILQQLDSLKKLRENTIASFDKKLQSLKEKTTSKLKALELAPEVSDRVSSLTKNID